MASLQSRACRLFLKLVVAPRFRGAGASVPKIRRATEKLSRYQRVPPDVDVQPTTAGLGVGELLALGAPLCFSAYIILTRRMSGQATQLGQLFWTCIGAFVVTGIMGWQVWQDPDNFAWGMIILTGLLAFVIYVLQIAALSQGEASVIVPFSYVSLATATGVGYMIWGELPNGLALAGIGLIAMSGIVIAVRS